MKPQIKTVNFGAHTLTIETGRMAKQATGSVLVDLDGTSVFVAAVGIKDCKEEKDFFPLRVDYQEKSYANGKIPGGFFKREGRPSEREILIARLIDRPVRPLFPKGFTQEVQIAAMLVSLNPEIEADIVAMIGASAALALSGMPYTDIMGAARVGYVNNDFVLNPTQDELKNSDLDLVVAGTNSSVLMVESEACELPEDVMLDAVMFGHKGFQPVIAAIEELANEAGKEKWDWELPEQNAQLRDTIESKYRQEIVSAYAIADKMVRRDRLTELRSGAEDEYVDESGESNSGVGKSEVSSIFESIESNVVRSFILEQKPRIDGRITTDIRNITTEVGVLGRTHGSALFTRGETQALVVATLGTKGDAQLIDGAFGERKDSFMLHYNFPPFSVGEVGMMGSPKRREIGHGNLAKRAIKAVLPDMNEFPYVLRVVSEILESNGSSSMASVCGTSLALMDAGVPISSPVAGIAMGLIKEGDNYAVLSDILGDEDHLGDMDFKVAGTESGITALQMDIKINGITEDIMRVALEQAKAGRMHILECMNSTIRESREDISIYAPKIVTFSIDPAKIKDVIGKGGATIKGLIEDTGASIDIQDDGTVQIATDNGEIAADLQQKIEDLTAEVEVGKIYTGKVVRILDFGAFVNILPGKDGLLHISQIAEHRVEDVRDELNEGQEVMVKVTDIDRQGRLKLTMKSLGDE